ncbi:MAG: metallophosphoesterase, partial [archaeon]
EILNEIKKKGLLLEREVFDLLESFQDVGLAKTFLEQIERVSGQKMITRSVLNKNVEYVRSFVSELGEGEKNSVERLIVNLGLTLEVRREHEVVRTDREKENVKQDYKVFYADTFPDKKLEVKDFTGHFKARYLELQRILMGRPEMQKDCVSINRIGSDRASLSIIGIVKEKRVTKNKNLIIVFEDLTGEISALVKFDKDIFEKAEELQMDDVVGVKASGNRDILFVHDLFFPDAFIHEKTKFERDVSVAFLSDLHCGGDKHLSEGVERFLAWINSEDGAARKINYIFFTGDNVDGVGIFPGQEESLELKTMKEQYSFLGKYLERIPKHITMFMCPGQHDATRVSEPQPLISRKYAPGLYEMENLVLVTNPAMVKLLEGDRQFKFLMYHGASMSVFINEIKELREMKAHRCPAKVGRHMLKRRHLAPMYGVSHQVVYVPTADKDPLVISEVPDVLCTGDLHRADVENYNGVLVIAGSCWQAQTPFEEKVGNIPDPCKVPVLNLKTRELKIFDFSGEVEK